MTDGSPFFCNPSVKGGDIVPVDDHGDDCGLRFERTQSSTVVVAVVVDRNWDHFAPATDALRVWKDFHETLTDVKCTLKILVATLRRLHLVELISRQIWPGSNIPTHHFGFTISQLLLFLIFQGTSFPQGSLRNHILFMFRKITPLARI